MEKLYEVRLVTLEYREDDEPVGIRRMLAEAVHAAFGSDCHAEVYVDGEKVFEEIISGSQLLDWAQGKLIPPN